MLYSNGRYHKSKLDEIINSFTIKHEHFVKVTNITKCNIVRTKP